MQFIFLSSAILNIVFDYIKPCVASRNTLKVWPTFIWSANRRHLLTILNRNVTRRREYILGDYKIGEEGISWDLNSVLIFVLSLKLYYLGM